MAALRRYSTHRRHRPDQPELDRKCQSGDVVDNLTGLAIGLAAGMAAGRLFDVRDSRRPG
jgi:hypothetical protein